MQVTCPVCQLQGAYDAEPGTTESRVVCARCSSEYEVVLVENQYVTALGDVSACAPGAKPFARPRPAEVTFDEPVLDDVFTVLVDDEAELLCVEPQPILEDVFTRASVAVAPEFDGRAASVEPSAAGESCAASEPVAPEAAETAAPPKASRAARYDGYGAGVRVMQASPLWLLVCGLAFISCIVLFNRITTQAGEEVEAASPRPAARNSATNQSAPSSFMPDVEIKSDASAPAAPAREEVAKETAQTVASVPAAETMTAVAEEKPAVVETMAAPVAEKAPEVAQTAAAEPSSGGKFTVQVGAHSASEKAEAQAAQVKSAGFDARVVAAQVPQRGTWYRVQAGRFETREEATRHGAQMRAKGAAQTVVVAEIQ